MDRYVLIALASLVGVIFLILFALVGDIVFGALAWFYTAIFIPKYVFIVSIPGAPDIYIERLVFVLLLPVVLYLLATGKERTLPNTKLEFWMIVQLSLLIISMFRTGFLATPGGGFQPFHVFLTGFFVPFCFYYFGKTFINTEERLRIFLWGCFPLFAYLVFTAYMEHFKINSLIFPKFITNPFLGIHYGRARGPFLVAPVNGWMMGSLFFATLLLRTETRSLLGKMLIYPVLFATPVAIFFTYTRAVWLSFLVAPLFVSVYSKRLLFPKRFLFLPLVFLIVLVWANWQNIKSKERAKGGVMQVEEVEVRFRLFKVSTLMIKDKPLFGVGFARFMEALPRYAPEVHPAGKEAMASQHNIFLAMLTEVGILGTLPFLMILYYLLKYSVLAYRFLGEEGLISRELIACFWGIMLVYIINALFIQTQYYIAPNSYVFLWAGIVTGVYQRITYPEAVFNEVYSYA